MMSIKEYFQVMKNIYTDLLTYLEEDNDDFNIQKLKEKFDLINIHDDQHTLMSLLRLTSIIANNHHRGPNFINKIEQILNIFESDIKKYYTNSQIFNIFRNNKRLLLFLVNQKILVIHEYIAKKIVTSKKYVNAKYPQYFAAEIKKFKDKEWFPKDGEDWINEINQEDLPKNFYENREIGQNENYICKLIRDDSIIEFITYINKKMISLDSEIQLSKYETNSFLLKPEQESLSLIQYAAFFGSVQIFQYLQINGAQLKSSIWPFIIHSNNPDLIHLIENNHIQPMNSKGVVSYKEIYEESIKCHHNSIASYIQNNFISDSAEIDLVKSFKYYNFAFIRLEDITQISFVNFCHYGYYLIAANMMKNDDLDVNQPEIVLKSLDKFKLGGTNILGLTIGIIIQMTPLFIAVAKDNLEITQLLLSNKKVDVNKPCIKNFEFFNAKGNKMVCNIGGFGNDTEFKISPLLIAVANENLEITQLLLSKNNINVNFLNEDRSKTTALHMAVIKRNTEIINELLKFKNINVNIRDDDGKTPIELSNDEQIISLIKSKQ